MYMVLCYNDLTCFIISDFGAWHVAYFCAVTVCAELAMEFALYLLPYILSPPMVGGRKKFPMEEAAQNFIQIHPVRCIYSECIVHVAL